MNIKDNILTLDDIDTTKLLYNPKSANFEKRMTEIEEFDFNIDKVNRKKALTYIVLMYDYNTPLIRLFNELPDRKRNAAIMAGFNIEGGFAVNVERCIFGKVKAFNRAIVKYLSLSNSTDFSVRAVLEDILFRYMADALEKPNAKTHDTLIKLREEVEKLTISLLRGEETDDIKQALYEGSEQVKLRLTVEDKKELMDKNGLEDYNPYPGYKPNRIMYHGSEIHEE